MYCIGISYEMASVIFWYGKIIVELHSSDIWTERLISFDNEISFFFENFVDVLYKSIIYKKLRYRHETHIFWPAKIDILC